MENISAVEYVAPDGATLTLTSTPEGFALENSATGEVAEADNFGAMLSHIRSTYGWPLQGKIVD